MTKTSRDVDNQQKKQQCHATVCKLYPSCGRYSNYLPPCATNVPVKKQTSSELRMNEERREYNISFKEDPLLTAFAEGQKYGRDEERRRLRDLLKAIFSDKAETADTLLHDPFTKLTSRRTLKIQGTTFAEAVLIVEEYLSEQHQQTFLKKE